jgi:hypothetical protein
LNLTDIDSFLLDSNSEIAQTDPKQMLLPKIGRAATALPPVLEVVQLVGWKAHNAVRGHADHPQIPNALSR